jgi:4-hydroxy-4-methyl-2-oxoglutarate aldolase
VEHVIVRQIERLPKEVVEEFKKTSTPSVHQSIVTKEENVMDPEIKPIARGTKLAGPAVTVFCPVGDNLMMHKAMTIAKPGDVLVINAQGYKKGVMWGDIATISAMAIGLAGVVVDGAIRDVGDIRKRGFPVFTRWVSPCGSTKTVPGSINIPITCGGVAVNPGDIIVGDDDGVVVVPKSEAAEVLKRAMERDAREVERKKTAAQGVLSYNLKPQWRKVIEDNVKEKDDP